MADEFFEVVPWDVILLDCEEVCDVFSREREGAGVLVYQKSPWGE